jgi:hypothetical protein
VRFSIRRGLSRAVAATVIAATTLLPYTALAASTVDQGNASAPLFGGATFGYIDPAGQEFTPAVNSLTAVDLMLSGGNSFLGPGSNVVVNIRQGTIAGPVLGSASQFVSSTAPPALVNFTFATPIAVTPGSTYVIEASTPGSEFMVFWYVGGTAASRDTYAGGRGIFQGGYGDPFYSGPFDWLFQTYGETTGGGGAAAGNSGSAKLCQKAGYAGVRGSDGTLFKNAGECVSYAARGGQLVPL